MESVWDDVRYDEAGSEDLRRQLAATALAIVEAVAVVEQESPLTTEDWHGAYRVDFDHESAAWLAVGTQLAESALAACAAVSAALAAAQAEQARRVALRQRLLEAGLTTSRPDPPAYPADPVGHWQ